MARQESKLVPVGLAVDCYIQPVVDFRMLVVEDLHKLVELVRLDNIQEVQQLEQEHQEQLQVEDSGTELRRMEEHCSNLAYWQLRQNHVGVVAHRSDPINLLIHLQPSKLDEA